MPSVALNLGAWDQELYAVWIDLAKNRPGAPIEPEFKCGQCHSEPVLSTRWRCQALCMPVGTNTECVIGCQEGCPRPWSWEMAIKPMPLTASQRASEVGDVGFKSSSSQSIIMSCVPELYSSISLGCSHSYAKREKKTLGGRVFELMIEIPKQLFFSVFTNISFTLMEILENHGFLLIFL